MHPAGCAPKPGQWLPASWDSAREGWRPWLHLELGDEEGCNWWYLKETLELPHRLIKGVQNEVVYTYAKVQSGECGSHSTLRAWVRKWAPVIIAAQSEPTSLQNHLKLKTEPNPQCLQEPWRSAKLARLA